MAGSALCDPEILTERIWDNLFIDAYAALSQESVGNSCNEVVETARKAFEDAGYIPKETETSVTEVEDSDTGHIKPESRRNRKQTPAKAKVKKVPFPTMPTGVHSLDGLLKRGYEDGLKCGRELLKTLTPV
ncbi:unnamed protein product [Notodromas monacha]|uniref:Uncharacterized protein n=1 Tax=Notodromas monacha TaxID=399045 RepID=A0A7R9BZ93_9CRUS|nr:unnamed protein product [Notodromas monacha]CAG0923059.1 unnamed protein product [Notodromas monacha]